jgi:hypothetical protein
MEAVPSGASFSSMQMVEALVDSSKKEERHGVPDSPYSQKTTNVGYFTWGYLWFSDFCH